MEEDDDDVAALLQGKQGWYLLLACPIMCPDGDARLFTVGLDMLLQRDEWRVEDVRTMRLVL